MFAAMAGPVMADCDLSVRLQAPVPYRVSLEDEGRRLVLAARQDAAPSLDEKPGCVRAVAERPGTTGWTAAGIDLDARYALGSVVLKSRNVAIHLTRTGPLADIAPPPADPVTKALPLIVLDPGHGGIDAGASRDGMNEKDLTLAFARALSEALIRTGRVRVDMTRTEDVYVSLSDRVAFARARGAAAFVSLHADALEQGKARGGAVFTLSATASDEAAAELVAIHDRADLLVGQDLGGAGDTLAGVILDLARTDTEPRSVALAKDLIDGLNGLPGALRKGALRSANFAVLKAPDIPSVLVELGFLSDSGDRAHLADPAWRTSAVDALRDGLMSWLSKDAVAARLRRR